MSALKIDVKKTFAQQVLQRDGHQYLVDPLYRVPIPARFFVPG